MIDWIVFQYSQGWKNSWCQGMESNGLGIQKYPRRGKKRGNDLKAHEEKGVVMVSIVPQQGGGLDDLEMMVSQQDVQYLGDDESLHRDKMKSWSGRPRLLLFQTSGN
ncbi:hypothetical protein C0J52_11175 [Blattella germanica]|nr:hypothetical protein C0J52_11175 [Blattella germanica]